MIENSIDIAMKEWLKVESETLNSLYKKIDYEKLNDVVEMVYYCKGNVYLTGVGTSFAICSKAANTFNYLGLHAFAVPSSEAVHGGFASLNENDVVIAVTKGGNTKEVIRAISIAKLRNLKLIGITANSKSELGKISDLVIDISNIEETCGENKFLTSTAIIVLAVFDTIASGIEQIKLLKKGKN